MTKNMIILSTTVRTHLGEQNCIVFIKILGK